MATKKKFNFAIPKENYKFLLIGFIVIIIGYLLMIGKPSDVIPNEFNYDIFSFRRIILAPIVILIGFGIEIFGILHIPKKYKNKD